MSMQDGTECHQEKMDNSTHCCHSNQMKPAVAGNSKDCCNGGSICQSDCNHCLVISVTGTLYSTASWPKSGKTDLAVTTQMPHFHSILLPQDLRPPIA
ncbi:hypothetical protein [Shewanella youngdeokensis]|uniref:Uncharacterized protein n=1 Tax=Shewanella youngdeokensis TaxID=2999068 RepID=A0ABZ0JYR0_9GAMM|nr:hypothetical protein RGE70_00985 [Shewanella sp. DAU334]